MLVFAPAAKDPRPLRYYEEKLDASAATGTAGKVRLRAVILQAVAAEAPALPADRNALCGADLAGPGDAVFSLRVVPCRFDV